MYELRMKMKLMNLFRGGVSLVLLSPGSAQAEYRLGYEDFKPGLSLSFQNSLSTL